nr:MAG TPA: Septum formation initiator [Caudoviricetes sp.]
MKNLSSKIIALCLVLAIIAFSFSFYGVYTRLAIMEEQNHAYERAILEYNATVEDLKHQLIKVVDIANKNAEVAVKPVPDKEKSKQVVKVKIKKEGQNEIASRSNYDFNLTGELDRVWEDTIGSKQQQ